jgi:Transposase DDE domain
VVKNLNATEEDWNLLTTFFPRRWRELAAETNALKGLRQDKSVEKYMRVLLLHIGCGISLRETAIRAKQADLADFSDVALLKRLRKSESWMHELCSALFIEKGIGSTVPAKQSLRVVDSTQVKEPGQTGSLWRIHYSLQWPSLKCDYFKLTASEGKGTGESFSHFPFRRGDHVLGDRGFCRADNVHLAEEHGARTLVRLNPHGMVLETKSGEPFPLCRRLGAITRTGQIREWPVWVPLAKKPPLAMRLCVIRKSEIAIKLAEKKLLRLRTKKGTSITPTTLFYGKFVMVLTTFPMEEFPTELVLAYYRFRWQIELVFKRFKQIAQLGHLPKYGDESARAWLYGKLFVAMLTEKIIAQARDFSPWGYDLEAQKPVA